MIVRRVCDTMRGRPSARVAPSEVVGATGRKKDEEVAGQRLPVAVGVGFEEGKEGGLISASSCSVFRKRVRRLFERRGKIDPDVSEYVSSIIRHALKATTARTDLTRRLPDRLPPTAFDPSELDSDSLNQNSERLSQLSLAQLEERLKQELKKDAGFSEEAAKVAEEEERKATAFHRGLRSIGVQRRSVTTRKWLKETAGKTVSAEGEPTSELEPELPDSRVPRTSAPLKWGKANLVHIIPPRGAEEVPSETAQQPPTKEVEVVAASRCCCLSSFLLFWH